MTAHYVISVVESIMFDTEPTETDILLFKTANKTDITEYQHHTPCTIQTDKHGDNIMHKLLHP